MEAKSLLSLPQDILVLLPDFLRNIEDYTSLACTCRALRTSMGMASPNQILRLAAAQSSTFFRPSPDFLAAATARELGHWARRSTANEQELALAFQQGAQGILDLAQGRAGCGLTMERIRELHLMRFSIINPVTDVIDKCVGKQWYSTPDFWNGGVDDAYTIDADPPVTLFHLATYGELFGPDFEAFLDSKEEEQEGAGAGASSPRTLSVDTRLEFVKYCVPDFATVCSAFDIKLPDGSVDPRRAVKPVGPYAPKTEGNVRDDHPECREQHNLALTWTINSSRWRPHWREMRAEVAGVEDFQEGGIADGWYYNEARHEKGDWRQRMWESVMWCQGLEGLGMMRPELRQGWAERVREWRERIEAKAARGGKEPAMVRVGRQTTLEYPYLPGDLRICASGYAGAT